MLQLIDQDGRHFVFKVAYADLQYFHCRLAPDWVAKFLDIKEECFLPKPISSSSFS